MSVPSLRRRRSRRALLTTIAATIGMALVDPRPSRGQGIPTPAISGDCRSEPGVELLAEWNLGFPVIDPVELVPPLDWVRFYHPTIPVTFLFPPDWTPVALWAGELSASGAPICSDVPIVQPQLTSERIVSPEGDAAFEFVTGTLSGLWLTPGQGAEVAEQGLVGDQVARTPLCAFEDANPLLPSWFHASYLDGSVLVSQGWPLPRSSVFGDSTILNYYTMAGPQIRFESLMRSVHIPILAQPTGGGGESNPTPTPWP